MQGIKFLLLLCVVCTGLVQGRPLMSRKLVRRNADAVPRLFRSSAQTPKATTVLGLYGATRTVALRDVTSTIYLPVTPETFAIPGGILSPLVPLDQSTNVQVTEVKPTPTIIASPTSEALVSTTRPHDVKSYEVPPIQWLDDLTDVDDEGDATTPLPSSSDDADQRSKLEYLSLPDPDTSEVLEEPLVTRRPVETDASTFFRSKGIELETVTPASIILEDSAPLRGPGPVEQNQSFGDTLDHLDCLVNNISDFKHVTKNRRSKRSTFHIKGTPVVLNVKGNKQPIKVTVEQFGGSSDFVDYRRLIQDLNRPKTTYPGIGYGPENYGETNYSPLSYYNTQYVSPEGLTDYYQPSRKPRSHAYDVPNNMQSSGYYQPSQQPQNSYNLPDNTQSSYYQPSQQPQNSYYPSDNMQSSKLQLPQNYWLDNYLAQVNKQPSPAQKGSTIAADSRRESERKLKMPSDLVDSEDVFVPNSRKKRSVESRSPCADAAARNKRRVIDEDTLSDFRQNGTLCGIFKSPRFHGMVRALSHRWIQIEEFGLKDKSLKINKVEVRLTRDPALEEKVLKPEVLNFKFTRSEPNNWFLINYDWFNPAPVVSIEITHPEENIYGKVDMTECFPPKPRSFSLDDTSDGVDAAHVDVISDKQIFLDDLNIPKNLTNLNFIVGLKSLPFSDSVIVYDDLNRNHEHLPPYKWSNALITLPEGIDNYQVEYFAIYDFATDKIYGQSEFDYGYPDVLLPPDWVLDIDMRERRRKLKVKNMKL